MIALAMCLLLATVPTNADLGLPPGVRGESDRHVYILLDDGSLGEQTVVSDDRFVAHTDWARGEHYVVSEAFGPQLLNAHVLSTGKSTLFNQHRMEASVWVDAADVSASSVAETASPIEHLRVFRWLRDHGVELTHEQRDGYDVYGCTDTLRSPPVLRRELWINQETGTLDLVKKIELVGEKNTYEIRFADWQPIEGTPWRHPRRVETVDPPIADGPAFTERIAVNITGVLDADAPPEFFELAPEVQVSDYRDMTLRDGTGKVLGDLPEPGASVSAAGSSGPGWLARLPGGSSTWLVAGGAAFVVLGAVAYRLARAKHAAA